MGTFIREMGTLCVGWEAGETEAATTSSKNLIEVGATAETRVWVWSLENMISVIIYSLSRCLLTCRALQDPS